MLREKGGANFESSRGWRSWWQLLRTWKWELWRSLWCSLWRKSGRMGKQGGEWWHDINLSPHSNAFWLIDESPFPSQIFAACHFLEEEKKMASFSRRRYALAATCLAAAVAATTAFTTNGKHMHLLYSKMFSFFWWRNADAIRVAGKHIRYICFQNEHHVLVSSSKIPVGIPFFTRDN